MNREMDLFFARMKKEYLMLTYDDVRLHTDHSNILPSATCLTTRFSRRIPLRNVIVSAAMDTVTEEKMAIALAKFGGIGIIHKNMSPKKQALQVERVKLHLNGLIEKPTHVESSQTLAEVLLVSKELSFHSFPVLEEGKLVGLLTEFDLELESDMSKTVREAMTPLKDVITASAGASIQDAFDLMRKHKRKLIPLIHADGSSAGMYVHTDLKRIRSGSMHNVDSRGHLRVAAAVGVGIGALERSELLAEKGCDALVIDTAHGDSQNVFNTIKQLRELYPHIDVVAGNVSCGTSAKRLADAGADAVIVGQGGGSICTTRIVAGIGCPQVSAVYDCVLALRGTGIPIIADGGIRNSGDIVIALAIGAESVILGRGLAGTKESPGEEKTVQGIKMKAYRGMASEAALKENAGSRERYRQEKGRKVVPEGVESLIPYVGDVREVLENLVGGVQSGLGYVGAQTIRDLTKKARIFRISPAGLSESHPHDVMISRQSPNYQGR